jgi:hypothetical protein
MIILSSYGRMSPRGRPGIIFRAVARKTNSGSALHIANATHPPAVCCRWIPDFVEAKCRFVERPDFSSKGIWRSSKVH